MEELLLAAYHEAGHAVAASMRGGSELISVHADIDGAGLTRHRSKPCDAGFIAYAGPWCEARASWPMPSLDEVDQDGCEFHDYVVAVLVDQSSDYRVVAAHHETCGHPELVAATEQTWEYELTEVWPRVRRLAEQLRQVEA